MVLRVFPPTTTPLVLTGPLRTIKESGSSIVADVAITQKVSKHDQEGAFGLFKICRLNFIKNILSFYLTTVTWW